MATITPGHHACLVYESDDEKRFGARSFVANGLREGGRVVYITESHADDVISMLDGDGFDPEACIADGRLSIVPPQLTYLAGGSFDPERAVDALRDQAAWTTEHGYPSLWIAAEMTWALRGVPGSEQLLAFERAVDELFDGQTVVALCQYDRRRFDAETILGATALHSHVVKRDEPAAAPAGSYLWIGSDEPGVVQLKGIVDLSNVNRFARAVDQVVAEGGDLHVDLAQLSFIDLTGLWVLHDATERLARAGRRLTLSSPPPTFDKVLDILGWDDLKRARTAPAAAALG